METPGTTQGPGAVIVGHVEPTDGDWSPDGRCSSVKTDLALVVAASLYLHRRERKVHSEFAPCWSRLASPVCVLIIYERGLLDLIFPSRSP